MASSGEPIGPHSGNRKLDWVRIRQDYIESTPKISFGELCTKYRVSMGYMSKRSNLEHWDVLRERYIQRLTEQMTEKKAEAVASEGAKWDDLCLQTAKLLLQLTVAEMTGEVPDGVKLPKPSQPMHSRDVAGAIKIAQDVGKSALGDRDSEGTGAVKIIISELLVPRPKEETDELASMVPPVTDAAMAAHSPKPEPEPEDND